MPHELISNDARINTWHTWDSNLCAASKIKTRSEGPVLLRRQLWEGQLWEGKRRRVLRTMSKNSFLSLILRGSAAKNWFWMPTGARIQRFSAANENFQKFDLNIFALGQRLSEGIRGFGDCSEEFEIYLGLPCLISDQAGVVRSTLPLDC
mgnify:CR=1 FL=1